jgi:hypothetical protein
MNALRFVVVGLAVAVFLSFSGTVHAKDAETDRRSGVAIDYEGSPIVTYTIINVPRKP